MKTSLLVLVFVGAVLVTGCSSQTLSPTEDPGERYLDAQIERLHQERQLLENECASLRKALDQTQRESDSLEAKLAGKEQELARLQQELAAEKTKGKEMEAKVTLVEAKKSAAQAQKLGAIFFLSGSTHLSQGDQRKLDDLADSLKQTGRLVYVDGHADKTPLKRTKGLYASAYDLSSMRACAVANYLVSKGVPKDQVVVRAFADNQPSPNGAASDRRVEVSLAAQ